MEITTEHINNWLVASIHGAFTIKSTTLVQTTLERALKESHPLLALDLTHVPFLDSSAIGAIISAKKQIEQKSGYLCIFGANEAISEIFDTVRLGKHITIYKDKVEFTSKT